MRKKIGLALSVAIVVPALSAGNAWAQTSGPTPGFYIGGEGGYTALEEMGTKSGSATGPTIRSNSGFAVGIDGGYAFGNGFRLEGELPFRYNGVDSLRAGNSSVGASGHITSQAAMANVFYDLNLFPSTKFTPYIGAGVGAARIGIDHLSSEGARLADDHDTKFAYQAIGGVQYALTPQWSVSLDYRYFASLDPSFTPSGGGGSYRTTYHTHNVMLGIAYHFGAPEAPPPMAEAPMPPPPVQQQAAVQAAPPPAQPQAFIVFFAFDKSDLTEEAKQVVANAAQFAKANGKSTIDITGYTDSSGTSAYNHRLSQRRADAVTAYLTTLGIGRTAIVEAARGPDNPRVPTAPNTREPQNRRVEIVMP
jgi:OmpA-OmpF porin, OOP family